MSWQFSFVHEWLLRKNILGLLTVPTTRKLEAYDGRAKRSCQVQHAHMYASKISTAVPVTKRVFWWTKSRAACGHQSQYQIINAQKGHQILTTDGGNDGSVVLVRCRIGARTTCGFTLDKIRTALPKAPWQGRLRSKKRSSKNDDGDIEPAIQPFMILKLGCMQVKCRVCSRGVNEVSRLDACWVRLRLDDSKCIRSSYSNEYSGGIRAQQEDARLWLARSPSPIRQWRVALKLSEDNEAVKKGPSNET